MKNLNFVPVTSALLPLFVFFADAIAEPVHFEFGQCEVVATEPSVNTMVREVFEDKTGRLAEECILSDDYWTRNKGLVFSVCDKQASDDDTFVVFGKGGVFDIQMIGFFYAQSRASIAGRHVSPDHQFDVHPKLVTQFVPQGSELDAGPFAIVENKVQDLGSEKTLGLEASRASVWLVRAGIEGSRPFGFADGTSAIPSFEIGLRWDGGDADTGLGADMGGGLAFVDPANGVSFDMRARGLVVHKVPGFREWGVGAAFAWDPRPGTDRGPSLLLTRNWGTSPSGGMDALLNRETLAGLAANDDGSEDGGFRSAGRIEGEIGYGLSMFGGDLTGMPSLGFGLSDGGARDYRVGWSLSPAVGGPLAFEASVNATRREPANGNEPPGHVIAFEATVNW